ncbi:hypothetical protein [Tenacibaculum discolor]|uniref:hypothetical protein n=1 Tax=Tenacibaculum discolor TaxID=361581 RepID=UPI000F16AB39|nr:hypothetical protein [Tenacibaculum discolor]RLK02501.1 hypothetical protein C8N27_1642 [Tenacibaculum discolor]
MRYFLIFFTLVLFAKCSSVPREYLTDDDTCYYNDPVFKISKEEMKIKVDKYYNEKNPIGTITVLNNSIVNKRYIRWEKKGYITNKQTNKQIKIEKWLRYNPEGYLSRVKFQYLNGNSNVYKETHYDNQGNITKVIDYEKGYNICWAEAIAIVKKIAKKEIEKYEITGFNLSHNNLNEFPNAKPEWQVTLDGNEEYELKDVKVYRIDGVTGKFLRTTKITTSYD